MADPDNQIEFVRGHMPKNEPIKYNWEHPPKKQFEPWHLVTLSLLLDVTILIFYLFIDVSIQMLLMIGYGGLISSYLCLLGSVWMLNYSKKEWTTPVRRISGLMNITSSLITTALLLLTLTLTL